MNEMLGYVFGSLENNRRDILNLKKCMNNQIKINKLNVFSGFCSIAAIWHHSICNVDDFCSLNNFAFIR